MGVELKVIKSDDAKRFEESLKNLSNKIGKIGWLKGESYDNEDHTQVAKVAAKNEVGDPSHNVPARPFMRPTIDKQKNVWISISSNEFKKIIKGKSNVGNLMELIGQNAKSEIQKTITQIWSPSLKPSTIRARINRYSNDKSLSSSTLKSRQRKLKKFVPSGLYKPLIDTGLMLSTIINIVEDE